MLLRCLLTFPDPQPADLAGSGLVDAPVVEVVGGHKIVGVLAAAPATADGVVAVECRIVAAVVVAPAAADIVVALDQKIAAVVVVVALAAVVDEAATAVVDNNTAVVVGHMIAEEAPVVETAAQLFVSSGWDVAVAVLAVAPDNNSTVATWHHMLDYSAHYSHPAHYFATDSETSELQDTLP